MHLITSLDCEILYYTTGQNHHCILSNLELLLVQHKARLLGGPVKRTAIMDHPWAGLSLCWITRSSKANHNPVNKHCRAAVCVALTSKSFGLKDIKFFLLLWNNLFYYAISLFLCNTTTQHTTTQQNTLLCDDGFNRGIMWQLSSTLTGDGAILGGTFLFQLRLRLTKPGRDWASSVPCLDSFTSMVQFPSKQWDFSLASISIHVSHYDRLGQENATTGKNCIQGWLVPLPSLSESCLKPGIFPQFVCAALDQGGKMLSYPSSAQFYKEIESSTSGV